MADAVQEQLQQALGDAYLLERELVPGGMSRLFVATEQSLQRQVVVKLLPPDLASDVSAERFRREMLVTARLQHPHILPVLNAGIREGLLYYVMPFVAGESLRARMEREGRFGVAETIAVLRELADALAYAHSAGVVHRDLKPENVLLQQNHVVLADFGVAGALAQPTGERLTGTGLGLGTLGYMAPEQLVGDRNVDARADLYALGVIAYEMLAGAPPFLGVTMQRILAAHLTEAAPAITDARSETPPGLAGLIAKLLEKDPASRPQSAADVIRAVDAISALGRRRERSRPVAAKTRGDAHDFLMATIAPNTILPAETVAHIRKSFVPRAFRKGQFFLRAGDVPLHGGFVTRGLFRMYTIDANGNESIVRFSAEGSWIGDLQSAISGVATQYFVDAIEPSEALIIDHPSFERMIELSPDKGHGYRMGLQRSRDAMERRIALYLHASAEERYADFLEHHPALAVRVPQRMLAAYLGITPETLSRIRRKTRDR